jgi:hypothetical protein
MSHTEDTFPSKPGFRLCDQGIKLFGGHRIRLIRGPRFIAVFVTQNCEARGPGRFLKTRKQQRAEGPISSLFRRAYPVKSP